VLHQAPTKDIHEDEIFYSTNPMETVRKALKKANIEYLGLINKRPLTQEDMARIVEIKTTITNYGEFLNPVHGELVDPTTTIGSSEGPIQKNGRHRKVQVRLF